MIKPDSSIAAENKNFTCLKGELSGNPRNVRLSPGIIKFNGEPTDQTGEYIVEITIRDKNRDTTLNLKTRFALEAK